MLEGSNKPPHVPFRTAKLTLCLREAFDITVRQPAHTVVIATVSSITSDASASINTLRYASQLLVAPSRRTNGAAAPIDPKDVTHWDHERVLLWLERVGVPQPKIVAPYENGLNLSRVPEFDFIARCMRSGVEKKEKAKKIYLGYWKLVVEGRTKKRTEEAKQWSELYKRRVKEEEEVEAQMRRVDL